MADWYVSSAVYAAVPQWATATAYTVGQFVRALAAPANPYQHYVHRCTTAGTTSGAEPAWNQNNNGTTASGTATFTNVTAQSTYGWSTAAGSLYVMTTVNVTRLAAGDRVFISSDHSETLGISTTWRYTSAGFGVVEIISVNRAGSVPPVAVDVTSGATITQTTGTLTFESRTPTYYSGITFSYAGTSLLFNSAEIRIFYFKNCAFVLTSGTAFNIGTANPAKVIWDNTTVQFGGTGQKIATGSTHLELIWLNTPSAIVGATIPTTLFNNAGAGGLAVTCRGVDLSAITGTLLTTATNGSQRILLDSCKIAPGVTRLSAPSSGSTSAEEIELVNCFDGTNYLNERYMAAGAVTTDRSTTLASGAQDDVGGYSLKLVSNANADKVVLLLDSFWLDVENTIVGSSRTAAVEIISSASLNNDDIRLLLEYMGTGGSAIASFADSLASVLTAAAALATSTNTWNNPPSTPVKQLLQVTFTPQAAGRVRGLVRLGKVSATIWVNPQLTIT